MKYELEKFQISFLAKYHLTCFHRDLLSRVINLVEQSYRFGSTMLLDHA